jgi:hypothetical protein
MEINPCFVFFLALKITSNSTVSITKALTVDLNSSQSTLTFSYKTQINFNPIITHSQSQIKVIAHIFSILNQRKIFIKSRKSCFPKKNHMPYYLCVNSCFFTVSFRELRYEQNLHWNGLSLVCVNTCLSIPCLLPNAFLQLLMEQQKMFIWSPLLIITYPGDSFSHSALSSNWFVTDESETKITMFFNESLWCIFLQFFILDNLSMNLVPFTNTWCSSE